MLNIGENRQVFIQIKYKKELKFFHLNIFWNKFSTEKISIDPH